MTEGHAEVFTRYMLAVVPTEPGIWRVLSLLAAVRQAHVDRADMAEPQRLLLEAAREALAEVPRETLDGIQCAWETRLS